MELIRDKQHGSWRTPAGEFPPSEFRPCHGDGRERLNFIQTNFVLLEAGWTSDRACADEHL